MSVMPIMSILYLFTTTHFNFSHLQSVLPICQKEITNLADLDQIVNTSKHDWNGISKMLLSSQNELLEDDYELVQATTKIYWEALINNLDDQFPKLEVLFAFEIFDIRAIPLDAHLYVSINGTAQFTDKDGQAVAVKCQKTKKQKQ